MYRTLRVTGSIWVAVFAAACGAEPATLMCGAGTRLENNQCLPVSILSCGPGTQLENNACIPISTLICAEGTMEVNGACVPVSPKPGHFLNPVVQLQNLEGVGSHTDEVRLKDNLLLNCSYTFNVIDVSDPADMEILSEGNRPVIPGDERRPGCKHLAWDGDLVFVTHLGNNRNPAYLSGWDITDRENIVQLPVLQEPGVSYEGIEVANHHIFVALHENGLGIYRYDTATATPAFARVGSLGGFSNAWGIDVRGETLFLADGADGLVTVDVRDPTRPVALGRIAIPGFGRFVVVEGDYAYVAAGAGGVAIVDVSNLTEPRVVSQIEMPGTAVRLAYSEGRIFVAAWSDVRVYDVTLPSAPRFIASIRVPRGYEYDDPNRERPTMRIFGVDARGQNIFVGTWENPYSYYLEPERHAPNIRLSETAARIDFGPVAPGTEATIPYEITNQGTAPLTISDSWISHSDFGIVPSHAVIAPNETIVVDLTYRAPTTTVAAEGLLHIVSDDPAYPVRKPFVIANGPGVTVGSRLPPTSATLLDGTPWTSEETSGNVLLLTYFATF